MKNLWIALLIVVVLGGGYMLWQSSAQPDTETPSGEMNNGESSSAAGNETGVNVEVDGSVSTTSMVATVTYDGKTFSPGAVTIKKGGTVTWNNEGTAEMWVASAQHPNHTTYSGTSRTAHCPDTSKTAFDQCAGGNNYTFKFDKVGTWNYHDHLNATAFGSVTVVE
ncbi:hypothetical protein COU18_03550 [Candidatus Kaiserbacteria bacterium CG10_big_fil_rev_8_21_14_0_10_51_14]|uniref:Blue (type 1) copper domain-containing protein n=1 Tax=Candidatus Kaiserbacteria bacterium CG10_big_fil_rev_8_21_14_0_10_51_14 TaxID=1974610 RepID=A0A2H0UBC3_9BACT|nr:MAG: hypothetical protein COU18_03550 [Candidatus Kaiserbacteria bacterium CG10_big_fil_rev_8_21_14_0_10_51_14]